jgi:hypothetical protein
MSEERIPRAILELTVSLNSHGITTKSLDLFHGSLGTILGRIANVVDNNLLSILSKLKSDGLSQTT